MQRFSNDVAILWARNSRRSDTDAKREDDRIVNTLRTGHSGLHDPNLEIRTLTREDVPAAAVLFAEGMRDNPLHLRVFGADATRRQQRLQRFFMSLARFVHANGVLYAALIEGKTVGVFGMIEPGRCQPSRLARLRLAAGLAMRQPPTQLWRIARWLTIWKRNDPPQPHWHLGPLAVRPEWRRRGIGRQLMLRGCQRLDALGATGCLETDLPINVAFYETLGFTVHRCEMVLDVPNWFMSRLPESISPAPVGSSSSSG